LSTFTKNTSPNGGQRKKISFRVNSVLEPDSKPEGKPSEDEEETQLKDTAIEIDNVDNFKQTCSLLPLQKPFMNFSSPSSRGNGTTTTADGGKQVP